MATVKQIRDDAAAMMAGLSALTARSITPRAMWIPARDRGDALPDVLVVPAERDVRLEGRGTRGDVVAVQVGICEALGQDAEAAATAGMVIADAIIDAFLGQRIGGSSNAICVSAKQLILAVPENWRQLQQLTTVLELSIKA